MKPPFGIVKLGKSFRNEITPGNFIFRTREFEQMEMEFFVAPEDADAKCHQSGLTLARSGTWIWASILRTCANTMFLTRSGRTTQAGTVDFEYRFGFQGVEWGELRVWLTALITT